MRERLRRLLLWIGWVAPRDDDLVDHGGKSYEEWAELYKSRGWPPPSQDGYHKLG